jgi:hypothetical protein
VYVCMYVRKAESTMMDHWNQPWMPGHCLPWSESPAESR